MPRRTLSVFALLVVVAVARADSPDAAKVAVDQKVLVEVQGHNQLLPNLMHLSDIIGHRLTGSASLEKANHWAADKMKAYGLADVRLEPWEIPVGWERGTATLKLLDPGPKMLAAASAGWAPGTDGTVIGDVVIVTPKTRAEMNAFKGKLKHAIILRDPPRPMAPVTDTSYGPSRRFAVDRKEQSEEEKKEYEAMLNELTPFFKAEGVAAVLRDSAKPHGLLVTTGRWKEGADRVTALDGVPSLFVPYEHYALLYRLVQEHKLTPKVEVNVTNTFVPGPVVVYNTVGEIRGSEKPDEFVVIGAHLDSWDLASGTTDNGTGSCVILEAARTLAELAKQGMGPKRTIRFVLFTGEEQGLHGSKAYCKRHEAEMPKTSVALVHDTGTGKVLGFSLMGRPAVERVLAPELGSLKAIGFEGLTLARSGGTDHLSFDDVKVPGFACRQDMDEYRFTHHTQSDTFDKAKGANLIQGAQVMALSALRVANLPELLPRDKPEEKKRGPKAKDDAEKKPEPEKKPVK